MPGPAMGVMVMMATHAGGSYPAVESDMMVPAPAFMAPYPAQVMQLTAQHPVAAAHSPVAMPLPSSPDSRRELRSPGGSDDRMGDEDEAAPSEPSLRSGETHPTKSSRSRKSKRSGRSAASSSRSGASEVALMMMRQQEAALIQTRADMAAQLQRIQEQMQRDAQVQKEEFMAELQRGAEQLRAETQNKAPGPETWKESEQTAETRARAEADQRAAERRLAEAAQALAQREQEAQTQADQLRQQAAQAHAMQTQAYEAQVQALRAEFERNQAATQKALRERDEQLRTALKMQQEWKKAAAKPSSTLPAETVTPASTTGFKPAGGFPTYIGQKQTNADEVQALQLAAALQNESGRAYVAMEGESEPEPEKQVRFSIDEQVDEVSSNLKSPSQIPEREVVNEGDRSMPTQAPAPASTSAVIAEEIFRVAEQMGWRSPANSAAA
ncbi:hypothetical protein BBJ28_00026327, partial [Nothophytophthora sp. Chile5]